MKEILIYGTGGHARVLADLAGACGLQVLAYFDDAAGGMPYSTAFRPEVPLLCGIGNNKVRKLIAERSVHIFATLVHPTAVVAASAEVGKGSVVLAGAVLQASVQVGKHAVINMNAAVDHDVIVGDYVSVYPGAYIGGGAEIGEGAVIGPNATVLRNAKVPSWTEVPPGAVFG
ncbi:transferase [Chitinophaga parva]|uniref:Transferase n=1 Tax=Chitinophaga parva TaxID=2169414 RepID=A0A2T7BIZ5_9BACT|nr:transferase [Chitinophaga parva]PUZ26257.1 transferase [Chitinophaga parva]